MSASESEKRHAAITASLHRIQNSINGPLQTFDLEYSVQAESPEEPTLPNPTPSEVGDAFETTVVVSGFESRSPSDKVKYLQAMNQWGYLPFEVAKRALKDECEYVRLWLSTHASLDYSEYIGTGEDGQFVLCTDRRRNLFLVLQEDTSELVRAALYSNPAWHFGKQNDKVHFGGQFREESFKSWFVNLSLSELERQALARNPNLNAYFAVELMRAQANDLKLTQGEHIVLINAAVRNTSLIRDSRDSRGDALDQWKLFVEIWELARTRWQDQQNVIGGVFRYIQTTQEVKLETYKEFNGADRAWLRNNILAGCTMTEDSAVITAGLLDPDEGCREEAAKRVGPYWRLLKSRRLRWRYWKELSFWGATLSETFMGLLTLLILALFLAMLVAGGWAFY